MRRAARTGGFSLVELLVAGTILTVLLSLLASFLAQQSELNKRTQARNEAQDKARVAMQLVVQDLQLAGASFYVDAAGDVQQELGDCPVVNSVASCFVADDDGPSDDFGSVYITTTRSDIAESCRQVFYALEGTNLMRVDGTTDCATPGTADPESTVANDGFADVETNLLASNVEAFNVVYRCSNGSWVDSYPTTACPPGSAYLRSAVVSIYVSSDNEYAGGTGETFDVVVVDPDDATKTATDAVACPADRTCLGVTQETLLPNLRNN